MPRHLTTRAGVFHYYRRVPKAFRDVDPRGFVEISLDTRDIKIAERKKATIAREVETYWLALKRGESDDAKERYLGAIERARLEGFEYRPLADIAAGDLSELLARIQRLEALGPDVLDGKAGAAGLQAFEALAGAAVRPELTLSTALDQYYSLTRDQVRRLSPEQLRIWRHARARAVANLRTVLQADKPISMINRADALAFLDWWTSRVIDEGYKPNTANKEIGTVSQMITTLDEKLELGIGKPFQGLRVIDEDDKERRAPFSIEQLKALVVPATLEGLNDEARGVILAMVETGMRPIEICGLEPEDILLDAEVPHVKVRPKQNRRLKTKYSERDIPLIGCSLAAMKAAPAGFPRYRDKSSQLSAVVNKVLRGRGLLPSDDHSLYSIRHSFKDRIVAVDMQDRMQDELMGHKHPRPVYGAGPTLAHKREWLLKIAIT